MDANTQTMTVVRDGKTMKSVPILGGRRPAHHVQRRMVISEKILQTRMDSRTVGLGGEYDIPDVPHAIR